MISKILQVFLFPPGLFILVTAAGFILFAAKKRRLAIILLSLSLGTMYLLSTGPVAEVLLLPLENRHPPLEGGPEYAAASIPPAETAAAIPVVVLGGGAIARSPAEAYKTSPTPDALKRLVYAVRLRKALDSRTANGGPLLISGGTVYPREGAEPEAAASKRFAAALGVPESRIIAETSSRNTYENAAETKKLVPDTNTVILVTSAYHMVRSVECFEARGFTVIPAPTDYKIDRGGGTVMEKLPSMGSLQASAAALREYWGLLYYRLRYY
jgi:uncharacterized SAM-binding protein YcdF (DUF218 family)